MLLENLFNPQANSVTTSEALERVLRTEARDAYTGESVTPLKSLQVSAVLAAVRVISESVAQIPLKVYRRNADGTVEEDRAHPLWALLHDSPNDLQTSYEWREMTQAHLCLRGNAFAIIGRAGVRGVRELIPVHPDRVEIVTNSSADIANPTITYRVTVDASRTSDGSGNIAGTGDSGRQIVVPSDRMLHLKGLSDNGIWGLSPIDLMKHSVGLAISTEKHGSRLFKNGARPGAVLKHPRSLSDVARANLRDSIADYEGAAMAFKTLLLEDGLEWQQVGMTSEDAQFLETRKFSVTEIARAFRVPPHMIADLDRATFSNIEQQAIEFVRYSLNPWLKRWEQRLNYALLDAPGRRTHFVEFVPDGLLKGDQAARYSAYSQALAAGWMTRNEVRSKENMNRLDGLDEPLTPLNMGQETDDGE